MTTFGLFASGTVGGAGSFDKAINAFEHAAKLAPTSAELQLALGDTYTHAGQPQKAIAAYEQALKLNPSLTEAQQALQELRGGAQKK